MASTPQISVVIPVKNGRDTLEACLRGILSQSLQDQIEIIVIDSGSTDGSLEIVSKFPVRLQQIPEAEFNHGETRNLGVRLARGEFVVMTVQDAVPAAAHWLATLVQHFSDPQVAGVCGQQIVAHDPDKNPLEWFRPSGPPEARRVRFANAREFAALPPETQLGFCGWDDVTAAYRRSILLEIPFQPVSFGEDFMWAKTALARGHTLVYEPRAQVRHYHAGNFSFRFQRAFTTQYFYHRSFNCCPAGKSLLVAWARAAYHLFRWKDVPWRKKPYWLTYNVSGELADWSARRLLSLVYFFRGDTGVDRLHQRLCGKSPQAPKANPLSKNQSMKCAV